MRIIRKVKPSIVALNETHLVGRRKVNLDPYTTWTRNRTEKGGGGISTSVAPQLKATTVGAGEGEGEEEYLVTRLDAFAPSITIINVYGEQRKVKVEEVEARWRRLRKEMEEVRARGELCLVAGDMNKLVGSDELGVEGNHGEVSPGGRLLRSLLALEDWCMVNSMGEEVVVGGPWTRVDPATGVGSCLDLFVVSRELRPHIKSLVIDSERKVTVARVVTRKKKRSLVFSDHFSCILTFQNMKMNKDDKRKMKETKWNLAKEDGWKRYKEISDIEAAKIVNAVEDETKSVEEVMKVFDKVHESIKFKAFGKVTIKEKQVGNVKTMKDQTEEEEAEALLKEEEDKMNKEMEEIKKAGRGKVGRVWEVRKKIVGNKKGPMIATAIRNPETKKLVVSNKEIKDVTLKYCMETLANNTPDKEFERKIEDKKKTVKDILDKTDGEFESCFETFNANIRKFKVSGKPTYDFITKAGKLFQKAVFKFCKRMFKEEDFPLEFRNTVLHMGDISQSAY